jgi:hypothetical protein
MSRSYGEDSAAVNVVIFDLNNGRGSRLFPRDDGRVVQKYFADARCRSASTNGAETSPVAIVAAYAERDTNGDGVVGYDDGAVLGSTLVSETSWRPLANGVTGIDHLTEMENGHCMALVRTGVQARAIEFDPVTGVAARNVELSLN